MSNGILCEQGKNRDASLLSETLQNEIHACKTREDKNPRHGQHPERDQNEIGTRYEFA